MVVIGGLSFGKPVLAGINKVLFEGRYNGVKSAKENGYEQKVEGVFSKSDGIRLEVVDLVADPTIINIRFKLSAKDANELKKFKNPETENKSIMNHFTITDDKGRILQTYGKDGIMSPPLTDEDGNEYWLTSGGDEDIDISKLNENEVYFGCVFTSSQGLLGDIKGLRIQTNMISNLEGNWDLKLDFDDFITNNEEVSYVAKDKNEKVEIIEAKGFATGIKIDFTVNEPIDELIILNAKLVDKNGKEYTTERPGWMENKNGKDYVSMTFDVSQYESLDEFDFIINGLDDSKVTLVKSYKIKKKD
ncbi:hypothetical protein [Faecalimicrobium dakarense]|uniref:hypothetical protein n=1 Tax=Faecalimicrobium dakarense TaxID=1301100 RepID=UPI0004B2D4BA|nr:hypothetical protein [[Clostridium] dakarense]